ncbi:hypothetical protein GCM10010508_39570 [Streptomyces naganishii JCM 4654]|uniref:Uncharacterized protein n=1 Tax=Streptomyces naganishii JCM 4654 TaxID=1306179 RepID=A0A918Y716_9ACTN|nr:hypothetical protein GCM10010508_39570 [Streptomyces naganishii JCM 4654]
MSSHTYVPGALRTYARTLRPARRAALTPLTRASMVTGTTRAPVELTASRHDTPPDGPSPVLTGYQVIPYRI